MTGLLAALLLQYPQLLLSVLYDGLELVQDLSLAPGTHREPLHQHQDPLRQGPRNQSVHVISEDSLSGDHP